MGAVDIKAAPSTGGFPNGKGFLAAAADDDEDDDGEGVEGPDRAGLVAVIMSLATSRVCTIMSLWYCWSRVLISLSFQDVWPTGALQVLDMLEVEQGWRMPKWLLLRLQLPLS